MVDSTCLMHSIEPPSIQVQGDPVIRALGESVSFGRFMTETLEWDKWSSFSENRYLEEAKRYAKPGLVAQKKALLEAHFKKTAADRAAAFLEMEAKNLSSVAGVEECSFVDENVCEPCVDSQSGKGDRCYLADAARKSAEASAVPILDSRYNERNDMTEKVSDFDGVNNSDPTFCVQMDQPSCDLAVGTTPDLQPCDTMDTLCDARKFYHKVMVAEPSLFQKFDPPDGVKTELDLSEVVNNSTMRLDDPQLKIAVQDPVDDSVPASNGNYKPILTCSNRLSSIRKPAVPSCSNLRRPGPPRKELVNIQSTRALGSAFLNKPRVTTKSLHMSINLDSSHQDSKRTLIPSKPGISKISTNPSILKKSKEFPDKIVTYTIKQKKQVTVSNKLPALRKSSAEFHSRPATPQLKKGKTLTVIQRESTLMLNTVDSRKSTPKSLHMPINLDSHVGEKEKLGFLKRNGTKGDSTLIRMSTTNTTRSAHAQGKPLISDTTTRTKQIIPTLHSSTFGTKLRPFHARPIPPPPLYKNKNSSIQRSSALTLSQIDMKKSLPKSLHLSVDLSSTAEVGRNPALAHKRPTSSNNTSTTRASRDSFSQGSLKESTRTGNILQLDDKGSKVTKTRLENTVNGMKDTEKCPPHKVGRPQTPTTLIRPPTPALSTPFRFRSDERAAKRKEKLEDKYKIESENFVQKKGGKFLSSRPQSPIFIRKPSPGKARETTNYKPRQTLATWKAGSYQVADNKISTASITTLTRKPTCENASPNINM